MSLLWDIWDSIVSKVLSLISSALANFKYWVNARISDAVAGIRQVYNNVTNYLTKVYNNVSNYLTNVYNDITNIISNVYHNVTENITNVFHTTTQVITNVIGVTAEALNKGLADNREWILNFAKLMDPLGFLRDPMGYITGVWNLLINPWVHGIVKAFWEGFEEGLAE